MKVTINVIKYETINGKKVGKAFSFPVDAKKMAKYKTEATVRKKVEEYIVKNGVFQKDEMNNFKVYYFVSRTDLRIFKPRSISSIEILSGGTNLKTSSPAVENKSPFERHSFSTSTGFTET